MSSSTFHQEPSDSNNNNHSQQEQLDLLQNTTLNTSPSNNPPHTSSSLQPTNPMSSTVDTGPVQAYAKLESDTFCYYIRTLQVMLGRRAGSTDQVDIHLGSTKGISRQHARLFYNFLNQRFELIVYGKNGAFVNEQFIEKGSTVPLEHRTKVQIGETTFHFLLPKMELEEATHENYSYLSGADEYHQGTRQTQSLQGQPQQTIPFPSELQAHLQPEPSLQTTHPHQQADLRHLPTTSASSAATEYDQADGTQGGEMFDTSEYNNKDVKPPFSYASLIAQAINTTPNKKLTLNGIYNYITSHYPYYQMAQNGWQNSIRHNLSLNKAFLKVPRGDNEPGKGAFWTIDASCEGQFRNGVYRKSRRQPSTKAGGSTGPVRPRTAGATSASPYDSQDPNRRQSTSSKSAVPAVGTVHSSNSVVAKNQPAGLGIATGVKVPIAGTTSLSGGVNFTSPGVTVPHNASAIPNASTAAALVVPQGSSSSYSSTPPYINSNIPLPASNAQTASTTLSPALQLLTAAASLSSPTVTTLATQNTNHSLPHVSATPEGFTSQRMAGTSDSTVSGTYASTSFPSADVSTDGPSAP